MSCAPQAEYAVAVDAIQRGDLETLGAELRGNPALATGRADGARTLLHVVADWPGHRPRAAELVAMLVAHGADPSSRFIGRHEETPLHWAASCDDVEALDALLDAGADIEAPGAVIGNGTPLADAVAFGQWQTAGRLVERGARTTLWQAAALGLLDRMRAHFSRDSLPAWSPRPSQPHSPAPDEITHAFWCACHGGQLEAAADLHARGADPGWIGYDGLTALDAARRSGSEPVVEWLAAHGARSAGDSS